MVNRYLWLLLWIFPLYAQAAELQLALSDRQVEMGKYLSLEILYHGGSDPGPADLQLWKQDFHIEWRDRSLQDDASGGMELIETLRLYPRQVGSTTLHSIALGGAISLPVDVVVSPALRKGIDGTPNWLPLPQKTWAGQALEIGVELTKFHPSNHIATEDLQLAGFDVQPLPQRSIQHEGQQRVQLRWQLIPRREGKHMLQLPQIEQRGRGRWRFHLSLQPLQVRPLPSYLPPTLLVGHTRIESRIMQTNKGPVWQIQIENAALQHEDIYGVSSALARIGGTSIDRITPERSPDSPVPRHIYHLPVPDWSWGLGTGPELKLHYFDTDNGRLEVLQHRLPAQWRIPAIAFYTLLPGGLVVTALVAWLVWRVLQLFIDRRRYRRQLHSAATPDQLRRLLLQTGGHQSLADWVAARPTAAREYLAAAINQLCFSAQPENDWSSIRRQAIGETTGQQGFNKADRPG